MKLTKSVKAFCKARRRPIANHAGNWLPDASKIYSCFVNRGNVAGINGLTPEGDAPIIFTNKYVYVKK